MQMDDASEAVDGATAGPRQPGSTPDHAPAASPSKPNASSLPSSSPSSSAPTPHLPPAFAAALEARLRQGQDRLKALQRQVQHAQTLYAHSWSLLSRSPSDPIIACGCEDGLQTLFDSRNGGSDMALSMASAPASATSETHIAAASSNAAIVTAIPSSSHSSLPRFQVGGLTIDAVQAFMELTESGEMWRVSVQLHRSSVGIHEEKASSGSACAGQEQKGWNELQLQLSLLPSSPSSPSSMAGPTYTPSVTSSSTLTSPAFLSHSCIVSLSGSNSNSRTSAPSSVCLSSRFPTSCLPHSVKHVRMSVAIGWKQNEKSTIFHVLANLDLPRWATPGQHCLLLNPNSQLEQDHGHSPGPLISLMDQSHELHLVLQRMPMSPTSKSASVDRDEAKMDMGMDMNMDMNVDGSSESKQSDFDLRRILMETCNWKQPNHDDRNIYAVHERCMMDWLSHHFRHRLSSPSRPLASRDSPTTSTSAALVESYQIGFVSPARGMHNMTSTMSSLFAPLTIVITGSHTLSVFGSSPASLLRFVTTWELELERRHLHAYIDTSDAAISTSTSTSTSLSPSSLPLPAASAQTSMRQLLHALTHENEGQRAAAQTHLSAICGGQAQGRTYGFGQRAAPVPPSINKHDYIRFLNESLRLQLFTDEQAMKAEASL